MRADAEIESEDFPTLEVIGGLGKGGERGTLVAQWKYRSSQGLGGLKRLGPYVSFVLRVSEDKQEWFYLGKQDSRRYNHRLQIVQDVLSYMCDRTNREIAVELNRRLRSTRGVGKKQ